MSEVVRYGPLGLPEPESTLVPRALPWDHGRENIPKVQRTITRNARRQGLGIMDGLPIHPTALAQLATVTLENPTPPVTLGGWR